MSTIIIGMDGKIESLVAAYLLKKQGHRCIGVSVACTTGNETVDKIMAPWLPENLENIKSYCDQLEIPYYATDGSGEFFDSVIDRLVAAKLQGIRYNPLQDFNKLIISKLVEKKKVLGADFVATGHFAKIYKNQITHEFHLLTSNDEENDESYGVASIDSSFYEHLLFPLADIRRFECEKIYALMGIKVKRDYKQLKEERNDFDLKKEVNLLTKELSSPHFVKEGTVFSYYDSRSLGEHESTLDFHLGLDKFNFKASAPVEKGLIVGKIVPSSGLIFLVKEEAMKCSHIYVEQFICEDKLDVSVPINCFFKMSANSEKIACTLHMKNNGAALIELKEEILELIPLGLAVAFYSRKGVGAKIIGCARIRSFGYYENSEYRYLPLTKDEEDVVKKPLVDIFQLRH